MFKVEGLPRLNNGSKPAVLTGGYKFAWLKLHWCTAMRTPDVLSHCHKVYAFSFFSFRISLATMTPELMLGLSRG